MGLLDAVALFLVDREGIAVEIVGELIKQRVFSSESVAVAIRHLAPRLFSLSLDRIS
jgi:hypothetical protein